jgi:intraflagellar transport protein 74
LEEVELLNFFVQEIEESDSDRQQKFRELRKREQDMDEFMRNFEDHKSKEVQTLSRIESEIVNCMEKISRNVHLATTLPEYVSFQIILLRQIHI